MGYKALDFNKVWRALNLNSATMIKDIVNQLNSNTENGSASVLEGFITQVGTADPTVSYLKQGIPTAVVARSSAGVYTFTKTGAFTSGKTVPNSKGESLVLDNGSWVHIAWTSANVITISTKNVAGVSGVLTDGLLTNQYFKIEVNP